jgi:hypothetical protein
MTLSLQGLAPYHSSGGACNCGRLIGRIVVEHVYASARQCGFEPANYLRNGVLFVETGNYYGDLMPLIQQRIGGARVPLPGRLLNLFSLGDAHVSAFMFDPRQFEKRCFRRMHGNLY